MDVFDGCYPYTATEKGCALTFTHQLTEHNSRGAGGEATNTEKSEPLPLEIDLRQERSVHDVVSYAPFYWEGIYKQLVQKDKAD